MPAAISIAMTTYNGARFIGEQLKSLAAQTVQPAELVVCDDGSTDETLRIIDAFAATASFHVRVVRNPERLGYRANFQKAAGLCDPASAFIAFCDQDDVWLPHKLETCLALAEKDKDILLVYHNATVVRENLQPLGTLDSQGAPQTINPPLSFGPWHFGQGFTIMFRRSLLEYSDEWLHSVDNNNSKEKEGHDQWFFFLASCLGSIGYVREPLVLYRQHGNNLFGWPATNKPSRTKEISALFAKIWATIHMSTEASGFEGCAKSARAKANILERMTSRFEGNLRQRIASTAVSCRKLEAIYLARVHMYRARKTVQRAIELIELTRENTYRRHTKWEGIGGRKAFLIDMVRGVLNPAGCG